MASHQSDLLTQDLILTGIFKHTKFTEFGLSYDFPFIRYNHENGDISYPIWQVEELRNFDLSEKNLKKLVDFLESELNKYREFLINFKKDIKSSNDKEEKIRKFFEYSLRAVATIPYFAFELSLYKKLEKENINPKKIQSSITDTSLASIGIEKIAKIHKNELESAKNYPKNISKKLKKDLKKFCQRFGYLGMIYFKGDSWKITDAYKMLFSKNDSSKINTLKPKNNSKYLKFASDLLRLRTLKWESMCYGTYLFRNYIEKFFPKEITYSDLLNLRINETLDIIEEKYPFKEERNREFFTLEITKDGVEFDIVKKVKKSTSESLETEINGQIAHEGKVIGIAKVILSAKESGKVELGDVLVTKMSTPDFLPAMKKAAAIITDIGGITSHAAIVSRELGIPCIIGTKIATQILKDGDLVKVDADKGIVKYTS